MLIINIRESFLNNLCYKHLFMQNFIYALHFFHKRININLILMFLNIF